MATTAHALRRAGLALRPTAASRMRLALVVAVVVAAPFLASPYWLTVLNQIGIAVIGAIGLNILVGFTGQISLGQGGFLAVGAYVSAILAARTGVPFPLDLVAAVLSTAAIGTLFGLPALRLTGLYLAIATLASQQVIIWVVTHWDAVTGGTGSLIVPPTELFGLSLSGDFRFYWVILFFAVLAVVCATNLFRTGTGRALIAIRDQPVAAEAIGIDTLRFKLLAFAVSSAFVGLAGALTAHYFSIVTWERFTLDVSILYLAMIIVGGLGSISGSIYGAAFMLATPALIGELARSFNQLAFLEPHLPAIEHLIFGVTIVLFLIFEPHGLARIWQRIKVRVAGWTHRPAGPAANDGGDQ